MDNQQSGQLSQADLIAYLYRDPRLRELFTPLSNLQSARPTPTSGQLLGEAAAVSDPLSLSALQRFSGIGVSPMTAINESHGLANKQRYESPGGIYGILGDLGRPR